MHLLLQPWTLGHFHLFNAVTAAAVAVGACVCSRPALALGHTPAVGLLATSCAAHVVPGARLWEYGSLAMSARVSSPSPGPHLH